MSGGGDVGARTRGDRGERASPEAVFARIGYAGSRAPTLETLSALQRRFLTAVPFENLDIHLGRPIVLERGRVVAKIVDRRRGGWCFEMNEVFTALLEALGFEVRRVACTVLLGGGDAGELHPFDHQGLIVTLDGRPWFADVGFGDSSLVPLDMTSEAPQPDGRRCYRLSSDGTGLRLESERTPGEWSALHRIDPRPREWAEFDERCRYLQTSPASKFVRKRLCYRVGERECLTLSGNRLGREGHWEPVPEARYLEVLRAHFGIDLGEARWVNPLAGR